jgi:hypothetical protein
VPPIARAAAIGERRDPRPVHIRHAVGVSLSIQQGIRTVIDTDAYHFWNMTVGMTRQVLDRATAPTLARPLQAQG